MNGFILYPPKMTKFSNQSLLHKPDVTYFKYEILFKYLRKKLKMLKKILLENAQERISLPSSKI